MDSATLEKPQESTGSTVELNHYYCPSCDPEISIAFCGTELEPIEGECSSEDVDCVVCLDVDHCPKCNGYGPI